ncbi:MAG TPA: DUF4230 domain-containing protein [Gemmatimonadales bacterium]|jgi:uncharacterized protein DUF4230|nr:DUF4230 domain-containing protein [Gemmatimonadales bacterium]
MRVSDRRVTTATLALVLVGLLVGGAVVVVLLVAGRVRSAVGSFTHPGSTTITQSVVVERMREVAQLVTSETTLRDVVLYRNSRLGSTKRSLVVVTGRILTGFDLDRGTEVRVEQAGRRIHLTLPRAAVLGVEVTELKTYDEERGLWNPFRPADRDSIFQLARRQLVATAGELALTRHAEESARRLIPALVGVEGYTTDVSFGPGAPPERDRP